MFVPRNRRRVPSFRKTELRMALGHGFGHGFGGGGAGGGDPTEIFDLDATTDDDITAAERHGYAVTVSGGGGNLTRVNSSGNIETVANNVLKADYDPVTLAVRGWIPWEARTNLCLHSSDLTQSAWVKVDSTITSNDTTGPDGTASGDLVTEGTAGSAVIRQDYTGTADTTQTFSRFFKRGNNDYVVLVISNAGIFSNRVEAWFNLNTGAKGTVASQGTGSGATATIEDYGGGWYRCTIIGAPNNSTTAFRVSIYATSGDNTYTRVNNATRYEWGGDINDDESFITAHIPTGASTVTRTALSVTYATSGITGFSATEGTMYVEGELAASNAYAAQLFSGANTRMSVLSTGTNYRFFGTNSSTQWDMNTGPAGSTFKAAGSYVANDIELSVDGVTPVTDVSATIPSVSSLHIGHQDGVAHHNAPIKVIRLYNETKDTASLTT